jgi:hypothetical protein
MVIRPPTERHRGALCLVEGGLLALAVEPRAANPAISNREHVHDSQTMSAMYDRLLVAVDRLETQRASS